MRFFRGGDRTASGDRSGLGKSFAGVLRYQMEGHRERPNPERVAWVAMRHLDTDDVRSAAKILRAEAQENPRVLRPVYHCGLSAPPGVHLERGQWERAADQLLAGLGLSGHAAVIVAHRDTDCEHVHLVVNRVGPTGRAWNNHRDGEKALAVVRELAQELGLPAPGLDRLSPRALPSAAVRESRRRGEPALAERVRAAAGEAFAAAVSWQDLEVRLGALGLRLERARRGSGLVVAEGSRRVSLSKVDRGLSGPRLATRFGESFAAYRARVPEPAPPARRPAEPLAGATVGERSASLVARLAATRATWSEADLVRAAAHEPDGRELVRAALASPAVVAVGEGMARQQRYSTGEYLAAEERLFRAAESLAGRGRAALPVAGVEAVLERASPALSAEQRAAVLQATSGADLAQIVGRAGTGKTTVARAIATAYREQGFAVVGAALAGKAAEGLGREAGIEARTLASWELAWQEGRAGLSGRSVLLVDEAGMVDTRRLAWLLTAAQAAGAKVVLLGDPAQLPPIGAGDAYRGLLESFPAARLEEIRRQAEPWMREASAALAAGRVGAALDAYDLAGALHSTESRQEALRSLVATWHAQGESTAAQPGLVVAYRNSEVQALNAAIRAGRLEVGEIAPGVRAAGGEYSAGERVVFLRNDRGRAVEDLAAGAPSPGVRNGTLGTLEAVAPGRFVARLDDGRRVVWDPRQYETFAHGYAVTLHKSQGVTVGRVYVLADPLMDRHGAYVALTRHREAVHLFADRATFRHREDLDRALSRPGRKDLARDYAAAELGRLAARRAYYEARQGSLSTEREGLSRAMWAHRHVEAGEKELSAAREELRRRAARVYAQPAAVVPALGADPRAARWLRAGHPERYGELAGRDRLFLGPDRRRQDALAGLPALAQALERHERAFTQAQASRGALAALGAAGAAEVGRALQALRALGYRLEDRQAAPEEALDRLASRLTDATARAALALLPAVTREIVRAIVYESVRVVERGLRM